MLIRHHHVRRVLVIFPTSLKHQWRDEITGFTAHQPVVVTGVMAVRAQLYRAESINAVNPEKSSKPQVRYLIANYETIARDLDAIAARGAKNCVTTRHCAHRNAA